jgi:glycosyltransferase involved in cell wall biosynthesis
LPRLLLYYHFFRPDDVVSARLYTDLAEEQRARGWDVTVVTSNRTWRDPHLRLPARDDWNGVQVRRVFRPPWDQARPLQRLGNSGWLIAAWLANTVALGRFDAAVVGSDPAFAPLIALGLRVLRPRAALALWSFDLYPEAIAAEGASRAADVLSPPARMLMSAAYRRYDALVDIGPRMRERLAEHAPVSTKSGAPFRQETLVPWALKEAAAPVPVDTATRAALFPRAKLALIYSGTMGRAHDFEAFVRLARACRARAGDAVSFCFCARGNRYEELRRAVASDDSNIAFAPFADEQTLEARLAAADFHLVSLRPDWAGLVVPSKFFASLAVGRPVLYAGPADSEIARWIAEHDLGIHLTDDNADAVADRLCRLADDPNLPGGLARWRENALGVYQRQWSRTITNDRWNALLRELVAAKHPVS